VKGLLIATQSRIERRRKNKRENEQAQNSEQNVSFSMLINNILCYANVEA
jgi:hypothetical protein